MANHLPHTRIHVNAKRLLIVIVLGAVSEIVNKLTPILLIRFGEQRLGLDRLGAAQYSISIAEILITLIVLGIPQRGVVHIAELYNKNDLNSLSQLMSSHFVLKFLQLLLVAGGFSLYLLTNPEAFEYLPILVALSPVIVASVFDSSHFLFARQKLAHLAGISILMRILSLVLVLSFVRDEQDAALFAFLTFGTNAITSIYTFRKVLQSIKLCWPGWHSVLAEFKHCLPYGGYLFFYTLSFRVDALLVEAMFSKEQLGQFMGVSKIYISLIPIIAYLSSAFFSEQLALQNAEKERKLIIYSFNMMLIPIGLLASCIWTVDRPLLALVLGESFADMSQIFSISVSSLMYLAVMFMVSAQVFMRQKNLWALNLIWAFTSLFGGLLAWLFASPWGLAGIAWGSYMARACLAILAVFVAERTLAQLKLKRDLFSNLGIYLLASTVALVLAPKLGLLSFPIVLTLHMIGIFLVQRSYLFDLFQHLRTKIQAYLGRHSL